MRIVCAQTRITSISWNPVTRGPAFRLIPTWQIEHADPSSAVPLEPLTQSIAAHGMLQPLLVRRHNGRYQLIAGRERLAAAIAAGVTDVPCLTYDIDETEAAGLADAENLRVPASDPSQLFAGGEGPQQALHLLSDELAGIASLTARLRAIPNGWQHRAFADLIQAQAWRAAWFADATAVVSSQHQATRATRGKPIGSIFDRVSAGFEAEARLTKLQLECSVTPSAAGFALDERLGVLAVTGCVFATLSWLEDCEEPRVEVRADSPNPRTLKIEVVQRMKPVSADVTRRLRAGVCDVGRLCVRPRSADP